MGRSRILEDGIVKDNKDNPVRDTADIELVIKIPEETYRRIQRLVSADYFEHDICGFSMRRIADGKPLPKGHGRIGDLDALEQEMINGIKAGNYEDGYEDYSNINSVDDCVDCVIYADTIIEADKEGVKDESF